MGVPTISSVTPSTGYPRRLVEIIGTNFQLPPAPAPTGVVPKPNPSVEVLFGTRKGSDVRVISATRLFVLAPTNDVGALGVTVRNIDQAGVVVPGETVTAAGAFTYALPDLTIEADLTRLVRAMIRELKRQVLANVAQLTHTDFDKVADALPYIELAELPALVLVGPELEENRFHSLNQPREVDEGGGVFSQLRPAYTVDLRFTLLGVTDRTVQCLNLMAETTKFFGRNKVLRMDVSATDSSLGEVEYEMEILPEGDFKGTSQPGNSNIRTFSGTFVVRGFDLDDADMNAYKSKALVDQWPVGADQTVVPGSAVTLDIQQTGESFDVGPSPGE